MIVELDIDEVEALLELLDFKNGCLRPSSPNLTQDQLNLVVRLTKLQMRLELLKKEREAKRK